MNDTTRLEPLSAARARQLLELMRQTSRDDDTALALDDAGRVTGPNMADWPRVWEAGEYKAARYQLVQLVRKLRRCRDDWGRGDVPAVAFPHPPAAGPGAAQGDAA